MSDPTTQVRPWEPSDGDTRCQECGHPNPVWWAPNDLWNATTGTPDNPRGEGIILCPSCFLARVPDVRAVLAETHAHLSEQLTETSLAGKNVRAWWVLDNLAALRDDPSLLVVTPHYTPAPTEEADRG